MRAMISLAAIAALSAGPFLLGCGQPASAGPGAADTWEAAARQYYGAIGAGDVDRLCNTVTPRQQASFRERAAVIRRVDSCREAAKIVLSGNSALDAEANRALAQHGTIEQIDTPRAGCVTAKASIDTPLPSSAILVVCRQKDGWHVDEGR